MTPPTAADPAARAARDPGSFRDPSGFVFWRDGRPYRQIQERFASEWDAFAGSALERRLIEQRDGSCPYEVAPLELAQAPGAHAVIAPEPIEFVSYPYEWTFGELRDAALLTLDAQLDALADGWTLRDASAFNVQFRAGRPILIDSLSFEPHEDGTPWVAYRQFCEHFLAPLALMARRDVRLAKPAALRDRRDPARPGREPAPVAHAAQLRPAVARPSPRPIAAAPCRQRGRGRGRPSGADPAQAAWWH